MIRVIGPSDSMYERILHYNSVIVKDNDDKMNMIEFIPSCSLEFTNGQIIITCSDNWISFLTCDYWRIEIE